MFTCCFRIMGILLVISRFYYSSWTLPSDDVASRIIGGDAAAPGDFPFMVGLFILTYNSTGFCGGAIINKRWVLTAGHCIRVGFVQAKMYFGTTNISDKNVLRVSTTVIVHPDYRYKDFVPYNDIALIKIHDPLSFTDLIQPVDSLAFEPLPDTPVILTVLGWGLDADNASSITEMLHYVNVFTISNEECKKYYDAEKVGENVVCSQPVSTRKICFGDSGGPLVQLTKEKKVIHVGIVSFGGPNLCQDPMPDAYTRTFYFREWIDSIINTTTVDLADTKRVEGGTELTGVTDDIAVRESRGNVSFVFNYLLLLILLAILRCL